MVFLLNGHNDDLLNDLDDEMLFHIYHKGMDVRRCVYVRELKDYMILKIVFDNIGRCTLYVFLKNLSF
jgi:hypothetical protein